jgi:uncharacterized lipoprotein YmbA
MKQALYHARLAIMALVALMTGGCFNFKQTVDPTRFYVLAPLPAETAPIAGATGDLALGLGRVDLPAYLTDPRIVVRQGTNEIRYADYLQWAERLDKGLQRVLSANLSRLAASNAVVLPTWNRRDVTAEVYVSVQQFEVDERGQVTLEARWRITSPGGELVWRTGHARIVRNGAALGSDAERAVGELSASLAELSHQIARAVQEAAADARVREAP